jgi:hypothetical protein
VTYLDIASPRVDEFPALRQAVDDGMAVPIVLSGETIKNPPVLSFAWIVNELTQLGVVVD